MAKPRKIAHGRGYSYEITYRVDGRMVRKRFPTLKLAEQALARAQGAALDGTYVFRGDAKMTIAEYAPTWLGSLRVEHSRWPATRRTEVPGSPRLDGHAPCARLRATALTLRSAV